ncbi:MAG: tRNA(fMet)-specific endonuclease VapC [Chloroflexi bacterium ADurb.Bin325]|nr:MAG: tRNA(fMet)-specific endonuclease VapC [Chloroflexi bacterium ADurb.Bin325]
MTVAYVDANVILRFLVGDPPDMAERAAVLMQAVDRGEVTLRVDEIIVAEVVWVLSSFYKYKAQEIAPRLLEFLSQDGVEVENSILSALALYGSKGIDFVDALLATHMQHAGVRYVFSFDRHFDRITGLERLEPGAAGQSSLRIDS